MSQAEKKADINKKRRETRLVKGEDVISNSNSIERGLSFFSVEFSETC